jgi:diguanylate cyclase (GGDEF)-like protein
VPKRSTVQSRAAGVGVAVPLLPASPADADLAAALDAVPLGLVLTRADGTVRAVNRGFRELWPGAQAAEGDGIEVLLRSLSGAAADAGGMLRRATEIFAHPEAGTSDRVRLRDGRMLRCESRPQLAGGRVDGRVWTFTDVTADAAGGSEPGAAEEHGLALWGARAAFWELDLDTDAVRVSPEAAALLGSAAPAPAEAFAAWLERLAPRSCEPVRGQIRAHADGRTPAFECTLRLDGEAGTVRWIGLRATAVPRPEGVATRLVGTLSDVTARQCEEERLRRGGLHDAMTDLANRTLFEERVRQSVLRCRRNGARLAVLALDFDRLKAVNAAMGHAVGDEVLRTVAGRLRQVLRASDTAARMGGDEFMVLLEDVQDAGDAMRVAGRIQAEVAAPVRVREWTVTPTFSIGIATNTPAGIEPDDLLRNAESAAYRAKRRGPGRVETFDPQMQARMATRLQLEADLRRAIEHDELALAFQPVVSLASGALAGFEALVRWEHPERGTLAPDEFIPLAEETGLIVPLGARVLRMACAQVAEWQQRFPVFPPLTVSVNVSAKQFAAPGLVDEVAAVLAETGVPPGCVNLEITESVLAQNVESVAQSLKGLRDLGVRISMDDFGTGYSSLSYLHQFPIDTLKIDRSFVSRLGPRSRAATIVGSIVALANSLGINTVAEGVETPEQREQLLKYGCVLGQGFLFARPLAPSDAAGWIYRWLIAGASAPQL